MIALLAASGLMLALLGCENEEIRTYEAERAQEEAASPEIASDRPAREAGDPPISGMSGMGGMATPQIEGPARILAAIIPHGESAWFVKLFGPADAVAEQTAQFTAFLESIEFADAADAEQPITWTLPEGWTEGEASGMRYATLLIEQGGEKPLDVSVMPAGGSILANVNRWRGQVGLDAVTQQQLEEQVERLDIDGNPAVLVNLVNENAGEAEAEAQDTAEAP